VTATVFLVRHAAHEHQGRRHVGRMEGVRLGPDHERHLGWLRARFAREDLAAVWASPVSRAQQTAAAVADGRVEVVTDAGLNEVDFGRWTGLSTDDVDADPEWRLWNASKSTFRIPGGESILEMQGRMVDAVDRARRAHVGGKVALCSHGDPIKSVIAYHLGAPVDRIDDFDVAPPSVSALVVGDWGAKVLFVNERPADA
jgi:broad specificity phosphatase PhoE